MLARAPAGYLSGEFWKDHILAASRTASKNTNVVTTSGRISFAKIHEPLEVPNLLDLQVDSFDWLVGNEVWRERVAAALAQGRTDVNTKSGLEEIFEEISPIEDFSETMSLSFRDHRFEEPKHSVEECKDRDVTYAAPLFVFAFIIWFVLWMDRRFERQAREIEEQRARADRLARVLPIITHEAFNEGADAMNKCARMNDWDTTNLELWKRSDAKRNLETL